MYELKNYMLTVLFLLLVTSCSREEGVMGSILPSTSLQGHEIRDIVSSDNTGSNWFKDQDINKWSFRKPIRSSKIGSLVEQDYLDANYGYDIPRISTSDETDIYNYFESGNIPDWAYLRPRGKDYNEAYRTGDFRLYDHAATNPFQITTVESSVPSGDEFHILCDFDFSSLLNWERWVIYKDMTAVANLPDLCLYSNRKLFPLTSSKMTIKDVKNLHNFNVPTANNTTGVKEGIYLVMFKSSNTLTTGDWLSIGTLQMPLFLDIFPVKFTITLDKAPTFEASVKVTSDIKGVGTERNLGGNTFISISKIQGRVIFTNSSNRVVTINGGSVRTRKYTDLTNPKDFEILTLLSFGSFTIQPNNSYGLDVNYNLSYYYLGTKNDYTVSCSANGSIEGGGSGVISESLDVSFT